ncbi:sensor histidine kinase [Streptomyces sp. NBC_00893]|uniref:sensor histidine kinase n=1 Tax=Streptomyces sp. NBC_00893 TaxID=2975862 RepID=UPI002250F404|nr:histidine kinase [Streptomyces sp. NBC_00893]MCX4846525.1 histidine kinase [Streptomyces sp. NBC_00893]
MLVRGWRRSWQQRSKLERIDLYSRLTLSVMPWLFTLSWQLVPFKSNIRHAPLPIALGVALLLVSLAQCLLSNRNVELSFAHYLGIAVFPRRRQLPPLVLLLVSLGLLATMAGVDGVDDAGLLIMAMNAPVAFAITQTLLVPVRTFLIQSFAVTALNIGVFAAVGVRGGILAGVVPASLFGCVLVLISVRPSAWSLSVMWQAEEARDLQARLAVAEERLRFGRDLHDVLGRNLAVIALKSELAVELAQRGRPEALDQMVEVQRIARTSQQEVRDVVRGYREADLSTELAGARGVLSAAGIECEVTGDAGGELPAPVQSALGWVVREAATNVLRHGDPRHCTIRLRSSADAVVLLVENDGAAAADAGQDGGSGVGDGSGSGGSGLVGLRERLRVLDGSLAAGPAGNDLFRLTATVPLGPAAPPARLDKPPAAREAPVLQEERR